MTIHGYPTTLSATTAMMALHMAAVAKGASSKFIIADLPFLSYRKGLMDSVHELMSAGAHAVKLEGVRGHAEIIRHIVDSGVPVMGHVYQDMIGLNPGFKPKFLRTYGTRSILFRLRLMRTIVM